jgi:hypothetical protein
VQAGIAKGRPCLAQIADNAPSLALSTGWPPSIGIGGRFRSDWVAACLGTTGRFPSEAVAALPRIPQLERLRRGRRLSPCSERVEDMYTEIKTGPVVSWTSSEGINDVCC